MGKSSLVICLLNNNVQERLFVDFFLFQKVKPNKRLKMYKLLSSFVDRNFTNGMSLNFVRF